MSISSAIASSIIGDAISGAITAPSTGGGAVFTPNAAFFAGRKGAAFDFDATHMFQDTGAATPVTTEASPILRANDLSGNGNHLLLPSGTTRASYNATAKTLRYDNVAGTPLSIPSLNLTGSDKVTIVYCRRRYDAVGNQILYEHGANVASVNGTFYVNENSATNQNHSMRATALSGMNLSLGAPGTNVLTIKHDAAGATAADETVIRLDGTSPSLTVGSAGPAGTGNFTTQNFWLGARTGNVNPWRGDLYRMVIIGGVVTTDEIEQLEAWCKARIEAPFFAAIGDSIIAPNVGNGWSLTPSLMGVGTPDSLAFAGDEISQQKAKWVARNNGTGFDAVFIQVGVNNCAVGDSAATIITELQDLIATVRADVRPDCKIYIAQMSPCRAWLGETDYLVWLAVNEAIAGNGGTPITGVDGRITSHVAAMGDGNDNLALVYNPNLDGVHPTDNGRQIIADAWTAQLVADGLA